jgi:hypothetical protein
MVQYSVICSVSAKINLLNCAVKDHETKVSQILEKPQGKIALEG